MLVQKKEARMLTSQAGVADESTSRVTFGSQSSNGDASTRGGAGAGNRGTSETSRAGSSSSNFGANGASLQRTSKKTQEKHKESGNAKNELRAETERIESLDLVGQ